MNSGWAIILWAMAGAPPDPGPRTVCPEEAGATATADRLSELPQEIRDDLMVLTDNEITDENVPLLRTDAPTKAERNHATVRFAQAMRFHNYWLVQYEVALFAGVRTVSYVSTGDGPFHRSPMFYFGGPACASIRAALDGVTTPGGF